MGLNFVKKRAFLCTKLRVPMLLAKDPPGSILILSISCSFWGNLAKSCVGASPGSWLPHLGEILDPPLLLTPIPRCNNTYSSEKVMFKLDPPPPPGATTA